MPLQGVFQFEIVIYYIKLSMLKITSEAVQQCEVILSFYQK